MSQAGLNNANNIPPPPGSVTDLQGNTGGVVSPDGSGVINVLGQTLYTTDGNPGTFTLNINPRVNAYPITPYVVGPVGAAGYQTVQSALDAANAAGGGMVWVQPGTYTENLTFYSGIQLSSPSEQSTTIVGIHTPPSSGTLNIDRIAFQSATDIFFSNALGTTSIIMEDCQVIVTNGYTFNLPNFNSLASVAVFNIGNFGTNDGFFNNTGGCQFYGFAAGIGNGTVNPLTISGTAIFANQIVIGCPVNLVTGASLSSYGSSYQHTLTLSNNATATSIGDTYSTGATPAITMSSSGALNITNATITSSNNPAIDGAGAGTITYAGLVFLSNTSFAGTLTLAAANWQPYGTAGSSVSAVRGTAGFNSSQFTVSSGFVSLRNPLFTWIDQAASSTLTANTGYFVTAASTQTLPAAPSQGDTVKIICDTASAVVVTANAGQTIRLSASASSAAGTFTNTARGDALELFYRAATTQWIALNAVGNWTVA